MNEDLINHTFTDECVHLTMNYIDSKKVKSSQWVCYFADHTIKWDTLIKDCEIYFRGEFLIIEYNNIIYEYSDSKETHPVIKNNLLAVLEYINYKKSAEWKTLKNLSFIMLAISLATNNDKWGFERKLHNKDKLSNWFTDFIIDAILKYNLRHSTKMSYSAD